MKYFKYIVVILATLVVAQLVFFIFFNTIPVMKIIIPILSGIILILIIITFIFSSKTQNFIRKKNEQAQSLKDIKTSHRKKKTTMDDYFDKLVEDLKFINNRSQFTSTILNNIHVNVFVVNRKGVITSVNKELIDTLNIDEKEIIGKNYQLLSNIEHEYLDSIFKEGILNRKLNNVEQTVTINNEEKQILKSISPIIDENNKLVSVVVSFVDVNRLKSIENKIMRVNKQLSNEMKMARRVQQKIIPDERYFTNIKNIDIAINYSSLQIMGGDIFDIIKLGNDEYGFFIADVSGHGTPASLITAMLKVSFITHTKEDPEPASVFSKMNDDIFGIIEGTGYFVSAYYCVINVNKGTFHYANAGHPPAILYNKINGTIEELDQRGTLLGIINSKIPEYHTGTVKLNKGDRVLLYTDGVTEAKNPNDEIYTKTRLIDFLKINSNLRLKTVVKNLIKDIENFSHGRKQTDDRAILYMEYNPKNID